MTHSMDPKLDKIMTRFNAKVDGGHYYEAQQTLRTVANRYVRGKKWPEAIDFITHGIHSFLEAGQMVLGADLTMYLLEVYNMSGAKCNEGNVARLVQILVGLDAEEPSLKVICTGMNNWSINNGTYKFGDPYLHCVIGKRLLEAGYVYDAERYLLLGTQDTMIKYSELMWDWYVQSGDDKAVGSFLSRLIFSYLSIYNIKYALESSRSFLETFIKNKNPKFEKFEKKHATVYFFPDYSELNFLQVLLIACQTGNAEYFTSLKAQYAEYAESYKQELAFLAIEYFNIRPQKPVNLLQDMMAGFFNGV
ncbi:protein GET4 Ecym_3129 [Eremothecium cymbalariae DBVPG|uniref:Golgi to ER traffic protein 4 n=1 Tax=Eremothecium cymbalariae (strain CBS 270.75 / DBVPG 7215 / KCTC 17166 / NRRL Y-17582) TaxID=931890 RepID=G8JR64_ERECY|nr:Hypothetical protein Ecym_3129 [Eremothecium cymbalariae DBVPG\